MSERKFGSPSVDELERAKKILIRQEQIKAFPSEFKDLTRGRPVYKQSKLVSLTPFLDEDDIIRVGGRIGKAPIPFVTRHPIVLDSSSDLTKLIIIDTHNKLGHAGVDNVRNELRQQFWILRCKATVKKNLHSCWLCKLRRTVPRPPRMAELPRDRLLVSPPFTKVGVDYFGPLQVKYVFWPATSEVWKKTIKEVHLSLHLPRNKSGPSGSSILSRNGLFYHVPPKVCGTER